MFFLTLFCQADLMGYDEHLVFDILQNLPSLEALNMFRVNISSKPLFSDATTKKSKLKSLDLDICFDNEESMNGVSALFKTVFQICPQLEFCELAGGPSDNDDWEEDDKDYGKPEDVLNLCFLDNPKMKKVYLNLECFAYYTFDVAGKEEGIWQDFDNKLESVKQVRFGGQYFIHLAWCGKIKHHLEPAQLRDHKSGHFDFLFQ